MQIPPHLLRRKIAIAPSKAQPPGPDQCAPLSSHNSSGNTCYRCPTCAVEEAVESFNMPGTSHTGTQLILMATPEDGEFDSLPFAGKETDIQLVLQQIS